MSTLSNCWMHWRKSLRFLLSERDHMKWLKQNERRSVRRLLRACNEWEKTVESSMTEQSTFKHVTRRARSSENRNAVNIERLCRMLNNSQENCSKLRNEQEMQLQTYWLKQQFFLWLNWLSSQVSISIFWFNLSTRYQSSDSIQILSFNILTRSDIDLESISDLSSWFNSSRNRIWRQES